MVQWLSEAMRREGLVWENGPNVSVNANSSDSHYEPTAEHCAPIREGDFVLIDIWGTAERSRAASFTTLRGPAWWAASRPSANSRSSTRCATRAMRRLPRWRRRLPTGTRIRGYEADDAARAVIHAAGFGEYFTHRTGHNIAREFTGRARTSTTWRRTMSGASAALHLLLRRAGHLSAGVRRAQRSGHDDVGHEGVGYGKDTARAGEDLKGRE